MGHFQNYKILSFIALIIAVIWCITPVVADNTSVSIAYRGAGGNYIGDTVIFDGFNSAGNITVLRITGPGLPSEGVPVNDLNGKTGGGNPVEVNPDGSWKFVWYTGSIKGIEMMQTARYYITAFDLNDPSKTATTSVMMKKPEFYVVPTPNPVEIGNYIQLLGTAEQGTPDVRIEIRDQNGNLLHVYDTAATDTGYFNYGFHIDMQPGDYPITVSSASMKSTFHTVIHVLPPQTPTPVPPTGAGETGQPGITAAVTTVMTTGVSATTSIPGSPVTITPAGSRTPESVPVSPLAIIAGLVIAALVIVLILVTGKKN